MHAYVAYGLGLHSEVALPELASGSAPADIVVRVGAIPDLPPEAGPEQVLVRAGADEMCLRWLETGAFLVRDGREIVLQPHPGADPTLLRGHLLGPVLALLLHQRGLLVLHGSGVALDGRAVLFLGDSGEGKSTTVAALHARGHPVIADDLAAIDLGRDGAPAALPAFPQLKLWPDALASLGEAAEALPRLHPRGTKRARRVGGLADGPCPLQRLYVLGQGETLRMEPLQGHAAVFALVRHGYIAPVLARLGSPDHLARCARLATVVPVHRLVRPRSLAQLGELVALVEADVLGRGGVGASA